jgi:hypothetical protein
MMVKKTKCSENKEDKFVPQAAVSLSKKESADTKREEDEDADEHI